MVRPFASIVAHRGLHHFDPENSLEAFVEARARGVHWAECDVWPSADGVPVVIHDETLDRTTTGTGPVGALSAGKLATLKLRHEDGTVDDRSHLPSLADVIRAVASKADPKAIGLYVEIKPQNDEAFVRELVDLLERRCEHWLIQSFDERTLRYARQEYGRFCAAYLVEDRPTLERAVRDAVSAQCDAAGWRLLNVRHDLLDEATVARLREADVRVGAWTVNTEADLRRVIDLRVDTIITDEPLVARKLLEGR